MGKDVTMVCDVGEGGFECQSLLPVLVFFHTLLPSYLTT